MRPLRADEIEVRVGQVYDGACTMLLYKNARVDMALLDELSGPMGWQRVHKNINGVMYCGVGVYDDASGHWVWKWDAGTESNTEKEKGAASDSFKRACVNWGIGRELYTAPRIKFEVATVQKKNGYGYELANKWEFYGLEVSHIMTEEINGVLTITELTLTQKGHTVYSYTKGDKR